MRVRDVLSRKGAAVATISPGSTVASVAAALAQHRVGALVVSSDGSGIEGIISERDLVRGLDTYGADLLQMPVGEIMTADVHTCGLGDEVSELARIMTDKRFRHMPVAVDGVLSGIVTIGDIVKIRLDELETEHEQLIGYISSG